MTVGIQGDEVTRQLDERRYAVVTAGERDGILGATEVTKRHSTLGSGDLVEGEWRGWPITVEQAADDQFVVRRFADANERELFVERRLGQYERMWDGCGCRIDYFESL